MSARQPGRGGWALWVGLLTLLALFLRAYYVVTAVVVDPVRGDAVQYHAYAWNLVHHATFSKALPGAEAVVPDSYRDPGYPSFLALGFLFAGEGDAWYAAILFGQAVLGALCVPLIAGVARRWLGERAALGVGVLAALWPHSITFAGHLLSETLFGFLALSAVWLASSALERRSVPLAAGAGLVFGMAGLTNAVLLPFAPLAAVVLAWKRLAPRGVALALLAGSLCLPLAWTARNAGLDASDDSARGRALINLVQGAWPEYHDVYREAVLRNDETARATLSRIEDQQRLMTASPVAGLQALATRFAASPGRYLAWYAWQKPALFWGWSIRMGQGGLYAYPTLQSPFERLPTWRALAAFCHAVNPWLLVLAALTVIVLVWRGPAAFVTTGSVAPLVLVVLLAAYATAVYTLLQAEQIGRAHV